MTSAGNGGEERSAPHELSLIEVAQREAAALREASTLPEPPEDLCPGYRIISELGRGGMGVVYKAHQLSTDRNVAVKIMLGGPFASTSAQERFRREIRLAARCQHPGIVRILEGGETSTGRPYFSMDLVEGVPLNRWVSVSRPEVRTILELFQEICDAIDYAHRHDVVHRDLTPRNVLVDREGHPHILDFGLSKAMDGVETDESPAVGLSIPGDVMGTLRYVSPEQARGVPGETDPRTDVYALGVMLFEALTGSHPYDCTGSSDDYIRRIREIPPTQPSHLRDQVGAELDTIILKALEKDRSERYQSVKDLGENLGRYLHGDPVYPRPPVRAYGLRKKLSRHRKSSWMSGVGTILAGAVVFLALRARQQEVLQARRQALGFRRDWEEGKQDSAALLAKADSLAGRYPHIHEASLLSALFRFEKGMHDDESWHIIDACENLERVVLEGSPFPGAYVALWDGICRIAEAERLEVCRRRPAPTDYPIPESAEAQYVQCFAISDTSLARQYAQRATSLDDKHSLAWERSYYLHIQARDLDAALEAARKLTELRSVPYRWLIAQARVLAKQRRFWTAADRCDEALDLCGSPFDGCPLDPDAYRTCAHIYLYLKDYRRAIVEYDNAVRAATRLPASGLGSAWPRYSRATVRWILGDLEGAVEDLRTFFAVRQQHFYAGARLCLILHELGRLDEAEDLLRESLDRAKAGSWPHKILECLSGRLDPQVLVDAAGADRVRRCEAYYYAGEASLRTGETLRARQYFKDCVATDVPLDPNKWPPAPPDPMNEYHLALWRLDLLSAEREAVSPDSLEAYTLHGQDR